MTLSTHQTSLLIIIGSCLCLFGAIFIVTNDSTPVLAQDNITQEDATCYNNLESFYTIASEACIGGAANSICNGGNPPIVEPAGPVANSLAPIASQVALSNVDALQTTPIADDGSNGGMMWMRVNEVGMSALLLGEVSVHDSSVEGFPDWSSVVVQTNPAEPTCSLAPRSAFVVQSQTPGIEISLVVNGISLRINGTIMVQTEGTQTIVLSLDGASRVISFGVSQSMVAGQQIRVTHAEGDFSAPIDTPSLPLPFEPRFVRNFPLPVLDIPTLMPQPGFVATQSDMNLRVEPNISSGIILLAPPNQVMTILGRNPTGDWYHVRMLSGFTGWMFAEFLRQEHGAIEAVYDDTPVPPQRFGAVGTRAQVISQFGADLRSAPYLNYQVIANIPLGTEVTLIARSPYNPWVSVDAGGTVGWVPLLSLETQAIIGSLSADYSVPLPPEPTAIPGLDGNAFPDPGCFPNC